MDIPAMVQFVRAEIAELEKEVQKFPKGRTARLIIKKEIRRLSEIIEPPERREGHCPTCGEPLVPRR